MSGEGPTVPLLPTLPPHDPVQWVLVVFGAALLLIGVLGIAAELIVWWRSRGESTASVQQATRGANSPNVNVPGNNNVVAVDSSEQPAPAAIQLTGSTLKSSSIRARGHDRVLDAKDSSADVDEWDLEK